MKIYNSNNELIQVSDEILNPRKNKYSYKDMKALCLYLKEHYGLGDYNIDRIKVGKMRGNDLIIEIRKNNMCYFTSLRRDYIIIKMNNEVI